MSGRREVARESPPTSRHIATPSRGAVAMASVDVVADALERLEDAGRASTPRAARTRARSRRGARGEARRDDGDDDAARRARAGRAPRRCGAREARRATRTRW